MSEINKYLEKVLHRQNLTFEESQRSFQIIMMGGATPVQVSALLVALRMKGETVDEITGAATVMRAKSGKIAAPENALDTCGTGGDQSGSFNISTAVAFVVAAAGVPVAKHGNRAISSKSGSADVIKELGVNIEAEREVMEQSLSEAGICFMMAPKFHQAMKHVAPIRQELGVRTIFNILGPLSNPADTKYQLLGVYSDKLLEPLAHVLNNLGAKRAWVVHGSDGMDEITTTGITHVAELKDGAVTTFTINPEEYGIKIVEADDLAGGNAMQNARELRLVLRGTGNKAFTDVVALNAAACFVVAGRADNIRQGLGIARGIIESGAANDVLSRLIEISNQ